MHPIQALREEISSQPPNRVYGRVVAIRGLLVEVAGPVHVMSIGSHVEIDSADGKTVHCEVVGFSGERALCMPFGPLEGVRMGCRALASANDATVRPADAWLGRVVNAMGVPIDGKGPLAIGAKAYRLRNRPPPAHLRQRVGKSIDLGVRALNTFLTCCRGQRMGIFAGSG
ncbi:MAG TPA: flagellum-specific ATP synthase FliI, partial [Hyphomicrobiales bacterium]|nr:flagellum-specific ATP synthase FliI [Hyphomicrobiales bacterium]